MGNDSTPKNQTNPQCSIVPESALETATEGAPLGKKIQENPSCLMVKKAIVPQNQSIECLKNA